MDDHTVQPTGLTGLNEVTEEEPINGIQPDLIFWMAAEDFKTYSVAVENQLINLDREDERIRTHLRDNTMPCQPLKVNSLNRL